jgi:hypothetical protein
LWAVVDRQTPPVVDTARWPHHYRSWPCGSTAAQQCREAGSINAAGYLSIDTENGYLSIELIDGAENGTPRSLKMPLAASPAAISLSGLWPPFGRLRRN